MQTTIRPAPILTRTASPSQPDWSDRFSARRLGAPSPPTHAPDKINSEGFSLTCRTLRTTHPVTRRTSTSTISTPTPTSSGRRCRSFGSWRGPPRRSPPAQLGGGRLPPPPPPPARPPAPHPTPPNPPPTP